MNIEKDFKYWVDYLIEEGYDLSNHTWDEMYEVYLDELVHEDFEYWVDSLHEDGYDLSNYTWEGLFEYFCENVLSEKFDTSNWEGSFRRNPPQPGDKTKYKKDDPIPSTATPSSPAAASAPMPSVPATPPKGPTILASRNGVAGTMIKGDPGSWKAKEGGYSSAEMQRIRSVGTNRYETQRKAAKTPEDFNKATQTGSEVWSMANPKLAKANAERELTRGTIMTSNSDAQSLMRYPEGAPTTGPGGSSEKTTPSIPTKPRLPQTPMAGREQMLQKNLRNSFDFSSPSKVAYDMAYLYQSIYEGKKKVDQDMDGDNDFADVMIARMVAAGIPKEEAIRKVKNKDYNF